MLVMAIVIIIQAPRCDPKETLQWVQESAMVQLYIQDPVDSNDDGIFDPQGEFGNYTARKTKLSCLF